METTEGRGKQKFLFERGFAAVAVALALVMSAWIIRTQRMELRQVRDELTRMHRRFATVRTELSGHRQALRRHRVAGSIVTGTSVWSRLDTTIAVQDGIYLITASECRSCSDWTHRLRDVDSMSRSALTELVLDRQVSSSSSKVASSGRLIGARGFFVDLLPSNELPIAAVVREGHVLALLRDVNTLVAELRSDDRVP